MQGRGEAARGREAAARVPLPAGRRGVGRSRQQMEGVGAGEAASTAATRGAAWRGVGRSGLGLQCRRRV